MKYTSQVDDYPGTEVARGYIQSYNTMKVIEAHRATTYSLQMGKWVKVVWYH
ncbi:hypothetical protein N9924_00965 [bacterium]|nr:hypothetical protein [bacterium]